MGASTIAPGGTVEPGRELVEPPAASLRLQGPQLVEFVEAEGHHARERGLVDVADEILQVDAVAGCVVVPRIDVGDADQVAGVAAEADNVVGIALVGERGELGALVAALDLDQRPLRRHPYHEPSGARATGVEHAPTEQPLEPEEHRPHELQQRGLARLVGAVEHLDSGAEPVDRRALQGAEPLDVDAFDEHPADSAGRGTKQEPRSVRPIR
jgi:hypothetical protein